MEDDFSRAIQSIENSISQIETIRNLKATSNRQAASDSISDVTTLAVRPRTPVDEVAKLPCHLLPPIRTQRFFDRVELIKQIESLFAGAGSEAEFQSLALYGLGGIGKSSIAFRYVETKLHKRELDASFWVRSETPTSIQQSFSEIAMRLKLPGARAADHQENHILVMEWLQSTRKLKVYSTLQHS